MRRDIAHNIHVRIGLLFVDSLCKHYNSDRDELAILQWNREEAEEGLLQRDFNQKLVTGGEW